MSERTYSQTRCPQCGGTDHIEIERIEEGEGWARSCNECDAIWGYNLSYTWLHTGEEVRALSKAMGGMAAEDE